ncbi:hypothetical protein [Rufibacter roseus]|uniref:Periplasmic heavy metal sensor n=1 Tax=Rufibacter roseus TaxID=1567108 RepID=A0ABW2DJ45_9BACT|nr:hypothetical protein [Rufibacter roseus]
MKILKNISRLALLFVGLLAATSAFAQQGQGARLTAAERAQMQVDRYQKQLDLTPEQTVKIKEIVLAGAEELDKMRASGARPDREAMQATALKRNEEIKAILTPEQQAKFDKLLADQLERRGQGGRGQRRN